MEELDFSNAERGVIRSVPDHDLPDHNDDGASCDDGSLCDDLDLNEGLEFSSDLDREWRRRHDQFHTIGYRDGLSAGKEKIAQEGFNDGFKQSVLVGHKWGLVRGVTSALACLPNDLKSKLAGTPETGEKLQSLCNSVGTVSAQDALRFFHAGILASETQEDVPNEIPSYGELGKYIEEFESLVESSTITLHSTDH